jgi:apolipoprotein N-acyltransferase
MNKGYIIPMTIIVLLLIAGGFVVFSQKPVSSPTIERVTSVEVQTTSTQTTSDTSEEVQEIEETPLEEDATTTTSIQTELLQCLKNEDCPDDKVCYFKPEGKIGSCIKMR